MKVTADTSTVYRTHRAHLIHVALSIERLLAVSMGGSVAGLEQTADVDQSCRKWAEAVPLHMPHYTSASLDGLLRPNKDGCKAPKVLIVIKRQCLTGFTHTGMDSTRPYHAPNTTS